jgi:hypothetical protein
MSVDRRVKKIMAMAGGDTMTAVVRQLSRSLTHCLNDHAHPLPPRPPLHPSGVKPTFLAQHGHTVLNPKLPDEDFDAALAIAHARFDKHKPDVVVGSSRGGALAMNLQAGETPLVLLCPAWKKYGTAKTIKANSTILHSRGDDVAPFADSEEPLARLATRKNASRMANVSLAGAGSTMFIGTSTMCCFSLDSGVWYRVYNSPFPESAA